MKFYSQFLFSATVKSVATLLLLLSATYSFSQSSGTLKGLVLDEPSRGAVIGANIFLLSEKSIGTASDDDGKFTLLLSPGNQVLVCSYLGYISDTFTVVMEAGKTTTYNILLKQESQLLDNIVVSAGKYEQRLEDITVSMELLKPKIIEARNTTNVIQVLEQVPGLNILDEEPQIRGGSGFAFGVGTRVLAMIDGIPILSGDAGKANWSFIPVENLDQVEVIKGAASVLYGSSALSGTINFLTSYPTAPSQTKIRLYTGFYSTPSNAAAKWWNGAANFSGLNINHAMKTEMFDVILGGQLLYDHNYIGPPVADPSLPFPQDSLNNSDIGDRSGRFNFNFRYRPKQAEGLSMGINGNAMLEHSNFSLVWGDDSAKIYRAFPSTLTLSDSWQFYLDPYITYFTPSGLHHELKSRIYMTNSDNTNSQSTKNESYYLEYEASKELTKIGQLHVTTGFVTTQSYVHAELYSSSGNLDNRMQNYALFAQLDKKFWDVLNLSAGFRGEYFQINATENTVKPIFRAGANLHLAKLTFMRFSYGQGYRYPTITEKYISTSVGGITVFPNPELQPETSWNGELGVKQGFKIAKFSGFVDLAAFWQEYFNTIEYNYALWEPQKAGFKFVNTGHTRVRGIDLSLTGDGKLSSTVGLTVIAGYTYTLPQSVEPHFEYAVDNPSEGFIPKPLSYISTSSDTTNYILKYRFQHIAKIDAEVSWKSLALGISERYYSFMQNIDQTFYDLDRPGLLPTGITNYREVHNNGTWVTDARISYVIKKNYRVSVVATNLFNLEYSLRPVKIESMRTVALQLRMEI
ncbi:MAG TPA: TonB-dependent receptor [Chitinophagales bacterium]|nr:TonB-dependent receptor [Chitinophagales bacterium]